MEGPRAPIGIGEDEDEDEDEWEGEDEGEEELGEVVMQTLAEELRKKAAEEVEVEL